jgi:hypothetical protein
LSQVLFLKVVARNGGGGGGAGRCERPRLLSLAHAFREYLPPVTQVEHFNDSNDEGFVVIRWTDRSRPRREMSRRFVRRDRRNGIQDGRPIH